MGRLIPRNACAVMQILESRRREGLCGAEIGVFRGDTARSLLQHFPELFLWLVDSWATYSPNDAYRLSGDSCGSLTAQQQIEHYEATLANTESARGRCRILRVPSTTAAQHVPDVSLDFAFIDADHTYDGVRADIAAWWPKIRNGGILTGHDYRYRTRRNWGVVRAVDEFAGSLGLTVGTHPAHVWSIAKPAGVQNDAQARASIGFVPPPRGERGVILYNRGTKCLIRLLVCLHSLRKWWNGPVSVFLEGPHPREFEEALRRFSAEIIRTSNPSAGPFIRKVEICFETPFDRSLWLDSDTIVCGPIDELFEYLDDYEVVTPHFANWWSHGRRIGKRIRQYEGKCPDDWITEAQRPHPAVNMGVYAFRADAKFLMPWLQLSRKGDHKQVFLPEEIAFQILYPQHRVGIVPAKFGVSVKHDPGTTDPRIVHYHGQKHVHEFPLCELWKADFRELLANRSVQLSRFLSLADRRLKKHLGIVDGVTLVTACDPNYVEKLRVTFPNWLKYKRVDQYPLLVFVNGIDLADSTLDFLRLPSVRLVAWDLAVAESQRERMLSAFVFGAAQYVETRWWMKLDADAYATDDRPLVTEAMKEFTVFGHRWGLSRTEYIQALDTWAAQHKRLGTPPMFDPSRVKGEKFQYPRTASYVQLQSSRFTRLCAKLAGERLPVPSHDTYLFYLADRLGYKIGRANFKHAYGFNNCSRLRGLKERVCA